MHTYKYAVANGSYPTKLPIHELYTENGYEAAFPVNPFNTSMCGTALLIKEPAANAIPIARHI